MYISDLPLSCRPYLGQLSLIVPPAEVDILVEVGWLELEDCPRVGLLLVKFIVSRPPATIREARNGGESQARTCHALACRKCGSLRGAGLVKRCVCSLSFSINIYSGIASGESKTEGNALIFPESMPIHCP